jgi:hypothetical protein
MEVGTGGLIVTVGFVENNSLPRIFFYKKICWRKKNSSQSPADTPQSP